MRILKLQVLKTHIENGVRCESEKCPITLALWDYFGSRYTKIETCSKIYLYKRNPHQYACFYPTPEMVIFIRDFDAGKKVHPVIFTINQELIDEDY